MEKLKLLADLFLLLSLMGSSLYWMFKDDWFKALVLLTLMTLVAKV